MAAAKRPDVFISFRFGEAMKEAKLLRSKLTALGLNVFICEVEPGGNIMEEVSSNLDACTMALVLGTETYGQKGSVSYSTKEEMAFIMGEHKPYFLVKMCERFAGPQTRLTFNQNISYELWLKGTPMPSDLPDKIKAKLDSIKVPAGTLHSSRGKAQHPPSDPPVSDNTIEIQVLSDSQEQNSSSPSEANESEELSPEMCCVLFLVAIIGIVILFSQL
jgi:hypothetical protein